MTVKPCQDRAVRMLALNVIYQALDDLTSPAPVGESALAVRPRVRCDAYRFCFSQDNAWRGSREYWAGLFGYSGDTVTRIALERLKVKPKVEAAKKPRKRLPPIEEILALGPELSLQQLAETFDLDMDSAYSVIMKLREKGFKVTLTGRRIYRIEM